MSRPRYNNSQPYSNRNQLPLQDYFQVSREESRHHTYPSHSPPLATFSLPQYNPQTQTPLDSAGYADIASNRLRTRRHSTDEQQYSVPIKSVPAPPPHQHLQARGWAQNPEYPFTNAAFPQTTPGADNFGEQAAGGIAGIAYGIADANARKSGIEALRTTPAYAARMEGKIQDHYGQPSSQNQNRAEQESSQSSLATLAAATFPPGISTSQSPSRPSRSPYDFNYDSYMDVPYNRYSRNIDSNLGDFDPNSIEDDGDDGLEYNQPPYRGSMLSLGHSDGNSMPSTAAGAAGGVAAGSVLGSFGGFVGRRLSGKIPQYDQVRDSYRGSGSPDSHDNLSDPVQREKSEWLAKESNGRSKLRWVVGILAGLIVLGGIAGGIVGGILSSQRHSSSGTPSGDSASTDTLNNGDLNKDSAEIKKLLNNSKLHKVFPGIDYTPMYTQYPDCLSYPASQNNVTRDLAVLSQLTNTIRLYGTDCNQTEMLIHSIDQLGLKGQIKIWMGVWQDTNKTTNARQLSQMYDIFEKYGADPFVGVILGNEVLFRKDITATELGNLISGVKTNLSRMGIPLPVASSDLGDDWTAQLASEVDYLMANIHPFFAGVSADVAASWTWDFWQTHNFVLKSDITKNIISETGWPSTGGTDCGGATTCTSGSVAGITEMNQFMDDWVCQALANGTNYFWFEAFDEPWKIRFNEDGKEWEDKWGLMDVNRNLKPGVIIPSCGGKTVS